MKSCNTSLVCISSLLVLAATPSQAAEIDIRYDNFGSVGANPIYGASADVIYNGTVISSPSRLESSGGIIGSMFPNGINDVDTMRIDLTNVSNYADLTRAGQTTPGPNVLFVNTQTGNSYDGSLPPNQDIANANRIYNNISITGNRATDSTPQSSFGFIGKGRGPDDTQGVDITIYSRGISLTNATLTNAIDTSTWYNSDCITSIGGSCHDGDITFVLGGGAYHSDAYIQLNNGTLRMNNQLLITTNAPLTLEVGAGESVLDLSTLTNMSNASGSFSMTGTSTERSRLSIIDTAHAITDNPDSVRISSRYLNLGHTGTLSFADLDLTHSSVSSSVDANWTVTDSTITMLQPTETSALRLGNVDLTRTDIRTRSFNKFIYMGYQTSGNSGTIHFEDVSVDYTNAAESLFEVRGTTTLIGDVELLGRNSGSIGSEYSTNLIDFIGNTTLSAGSTLSFDNAHFTQLETDPGSLTRLIEGAVVNMGSGTFNGNFIGAGEITGLGSGMTFNDNVTVDHMQRNGKNSYSRTSIYNALTISSKDVTFGSKANLVLDARLFLKNPQVFQADQLSVRVADLNSLPNVTLNLQENQFGGLPTASELDGGELMIVEVVDLIDPNFAVGASMNFDPTTDTQITSGANVPALVSLSAIEVPSYNVDIGGGLTRTANVSVQMTELPASAITQHPGATQNSNNQGVSNLVATASNTSTSVSNALSSLTNQQVAPHLQSIQPEAYSSHMSIGLEQNRRVINAVLQRIDTHTTSAAGNNSATPDGQADLPNDVQRNLWIDSFYIDGSFDRDGELAAFDYELYNYLIGADLKTGPDGGIGLYTGYGYYKMSDHDSSDQSFTTDAFNLGIYALKHTEHFNLRAMLGYAYGDNDHERVTRLGSVTENAKAEFDSHNILTGIIASKNYTLAQNLYIRPEVGQYYTYYYQESFKETNAPTTGLDLDSADAHALISIIGAEIGSQQYYGSTVQIRPIVFTQATYDWLAEDDDAHKIKAGLIANPGTQETFVGQTRGHASISLGGGLEGQIGANCTFRISGFHDWQDHGDASGIGGNIEFRHIW